MKKQLECRACRNKLLGIKTRLQVVHTCDLMKPINDFDIAEETKYFDKYFKKYKGEGGLNL